VDIVKNTTFIVRNNFVSASDAEKLHVVRSNIVRMLVKKSFENTEVLDNHVDDADNLCYNNTSIINNGCTSEEEEQP